MSERLSVFISSAQNNENGFIWRDVRRRIKEYLAECPYLNPFIIEDVASGIPSNQLFEYHVQKSDIIVLLVKGDLRQGTAKEFTIATKNRKPLMVYFLEDENPSLDVARLKKSIQESDYCTYHELKTFDKIEIGIRNEIIEDVIRFFQYRHFQQDDNEQAENTFLLQEIEPMKVSAPTKTIVALFNSSYEYIYDLIGLSYLKEKKNCDEAEFHHLGQTMLEWLILGRAFDSEKEILCLINKCEEIYSNIDWLIKRWDAIRFAVAGNFEKALESEKQALEIAKKVDVPKWIYNDILIDCRNLELSVNQIQRTHLSISAVQKELEVSETIVYLPVLDRYLENAYENVIQEEIKIGIASPDTIFWGSNIYATITEIENYFFSALLYGSYTHILLTRKVLGNILFKYAELTKDKELYLSVVRLKILQGQSKEFRQIVQRKWDESYSGITSNANDFWKISDNVSIEYRDSIKQAIFSMLGMYFSNEVFSIAEEYMHSFSTQVYWGNSEDYFKCIYNNISRLNHKRIVKILIDIIKEQKFNLGGTLSSIILHLDISHIDIELQKELSDALVKQLSYIVQNNGSPQIIAALENANEDIFSVLHSVPDNGLVGAEKDLYDINRGKGDWKKVLVKEIEIAQKQFEANKIPGVTSVFGNRPYAMIQKIVRNYYELGMEQIFSKSFLPLCVTVLKSQAAISYKEDCISCLCDVLVLAQIDKSQISKDLIEAILELDVSKEQCVAIDVEGAKGAFACRILMLKVLAGVISKEELFELCIGYNKKNISERIALIECIEQYLLHIYAKDKQEKVDAVIISIILQCFEDEQYGVRYRACNCLAHLIATPSNDIAEHKLYEAVLDSSHYVRNNILRLCKEGIIKDASISEKLVELLKNDANYAIREYANH